MSWSKVSDRRWERPVNGMEGYFVTTGNLTASLCDGREHYVIFSKVKVDIKIPDVALALKNAWKQLRHEQPQIASTVEGMKKVYEVPDEAALEEWLASTFIVSSCQDAEELYRNSEPIKQATLYYLPQSSELVLRAHHYTLDGTGAIMFWDRYLSMLVNPAKDMQFGDEHARLAPALEEALGYSEPSTEEQKEKAKARLMEYAGNIPGIGPVSKLGSAPSGRRQNAELLFSKETTAAIIAACKEKGITVTSAVHAAYVQTMMRYADPKSKLSKYVTANLFNLRCHLPAPYNSSQHAVSVYYTPQPFYLALPSSFWHTAQVLNKYYKTTFRDNRELLELNGPFTRALCDVAQTPEFLASPPPKDALVSSLGIAEKHVQRTYGRTVTVKDLKVGVDVVLGMSMMFLYTFQDQLRLVYCFNEGFEETPNIQTYLNEIRTVLEEELLNRQRNWLLSYCNVM
ncbi:hypothetical protein ASPWEDRAFT_134859 [Aspergillus wentii DTO 134E9]|uniref:Condensation domain-containing protein n=1 Tax=Aspergillus wentii DTO 134E9 TaxID=1073089 RepID=A0A1L9RMJ4_ASPWE|nr:uncharacterized protein ASPWEDRAFT_134859 [Aspergillus wentii DTO 134E9]KAI9929402.1 hypothetical protein MW887_000872 [Aspergillus wentii]OJJ36156.1 hypothetical protein ASPWEDRAFT_134859 [Aspergillus wentii DTO 134E9]